MIRAVIKIRIKALTLILFVLSCNTILAQKDTVLLEYFPQEKTGIRFKNTITETEQRNIMIKGMPYIYAGGGVAVGDVNNDELPDIFLVGNEVPSKLYLNQGSLNFKDVTQVYGIATKAWCTGTVMTDVNGDGWLDIYVLKAQNNDSATGGNMLYINQGGKKFLESAAVFGLNTNTRCLSASFFDMDNDGDLDLYLARYPDNSSFGNAINFDFNRTFKPGYGTDYLFENINNKKFADITASAGIKEENGFGISVITADFNRDGYADIYVGNDFSDQDYLYLNNGNKTFTDALQSKFAHTSFFTMGLDYNDLNNDLIPDLITLDMNPDDLKKYKTDFNGFDYDLHKKTKANYYNQEIRNTLQFQNKNGSYSDIAQIDKVAFTDWSWSPLIADLDNDGLKDIFITNGLKKDLLNQNFYLFELDSILKSQNKAIGTGTDTEILSVIAPMSLPNYFFQNKGDHRFSNTSSSWTNAPSSVSTGAAYSDLDMDGDLDLITNDIDTFPIVYKNNARELTGNNFIGFHIKNGNSPAFGAKVFLFAGGKTLYQELITTRGFMSSSQPLVHFGLNKINTVDSVIITYQGNTKGLVIYNAEINTYHAINLAFAGKPKSIPDPFAGHVNFNLTTVITHSDTTARKDDFTFQPLLYQRYSQTSPVMLPSDLNKDGLTDIIYGAFGDKPLRILLQKSDGSFNEIALPELSVTIGYDHIKLRLSDLDNDNNLELVTIANDFYYTSGKNNSEKNSKNFLQVFTLKNVNSTIHVVQHSGFPVVKNPLSAIVLADANVDGNKEIYLFGATALDIFPKSYPALIISKQNNSFRLDTFIATPTSQNFSDYIITDAGTCDFNLDNLPDIHFSTHYNRPFMLENNFRKYNMPLLSSGGNGFWNKNVPLDIDKDGKLDVINLNFGLNTRFNLKHEERLSLITADFDNNGQFDPVTCITDKGKDYPIYTYSNFTSYFPYSRKKTYDYKEYSNATLDDIYPTETVNKKYVETLVSQVKLAYGKIVPFPNELHWTTWNDVFVDTLNNRLIFGGNNFNMRPDIGYSDAASLIIVHYRFSSENEIEFFNTLVYNMPNIEVKQVESCKSPKGTILLLATQHGIYLTDILISK